MLLALAFVLEADVVNPFTELCREYPQELHPSMYNDFKRQRLRTVPTKKWSELQTRLESIEGEYDPRPRMEYLRAIAANWNISLRCVCETIRVTVSNVDKLNFTWSILYFGEEVLLWVVVIISNA